MQALWDRWTDEADAEGVTDFEGLQRRAAREVFISGEVFFRKRVRRPQDKLSVPLQLEMLPSEMLPMNDNRILPYGSSMRGEGAWPTISTKSIRVTLLSRGSPEKR